MFVVGSPRSGTTFLAGTIGALPGFVDLSEVTPHKAAIAELARLPEAEAARRIRTMLERVRAARARARAARASSRRPRRPSCSPRRCAPTREGRAVHVVRDGRDVVCSLLDRGWLSAGRDGGDDARLAYGAGGALLGRAGAVGGVRGGERRHPRRLGLALVPRGGARRAAERATFELRYESIAANPSRRGRRSPTISASTARRSRAGSSASTTARSAATAATSRRSSSPTSSGRRATLLAALGYA